MKSQGWSVVEGKFGSYIELHSDRPIPVRSRYPVMIIDGVEYDAIISPDRKVLRTTVPIIEVDDVKEVTSPDLFLACRGLQDKRSKGNQPEEPGSTRLIAPDALSLGRYTVSRYDYDYGDEALELPDGWSGLEYRAAVYMSDAGGVCPVVVLLHGRHATCTFPGSSYWPCRDGTHSIPSFEGYGIAAEALASHGYVVVSLSANALILGGEQDFLSLFDGSRITVPTLPRAVVQSTPYFPVSSCYMVQSFETMHSHENASMPGEWDWTITQGAGEIIASPLPSFRGLRSTHHRRHSFLNLRSVDALTPAELKLQVRNQGGPVDLSLYTHLSFHIDYMQEESAAEKVELQVRLDGATVDLTGTFREGWPIPEIITGVETFLQRQISVPLKDFALQGPVSELMFTLSRGGNIGLSDIAFVKPSIGKNEPLKLPFVSAMEDVMVVATGDEQVLEVEVFLSEVSLVRVPMWVSFRLIHRILGEMKFEAPMVIEAGEQSKIASFIVPEGGFRSVLGGEVDGAPCYVVPVKLEALANALFARPSTRFLVLPFP